MHPCNVTTCKGDNGNPALIADTDPFCQYHRDKVRNAILALPRLYDRLDEIIGDRNTAGSREDLGRSGTRTPPVPINVHVRSLQDDMVGITRRAVLGYHTRRGLTLTMRISRAERKGLGRHVAFITAHLDAILGDEVRVGLDLVRVSRAAGYAVGDKPLIHHLPAPCPDCNCMGLRRTDGGSWVRCHACGLTFGEDAYGVLVRVLVDANQDPPDIPRPPKGQRLRCDALTASGNGLICRMEAGHKWCSHLTYADGYTEWETWR